MIELCALFDAFLVTLGAIVSFSLALRQSTGRARAFLLRSMLGIWAIAFLPMLAESGDWVHLTWSAEVPLVCLFLLSGAQLFTIWPLDAAFFAPHADPRFEHAPPPRFGPASWFFAMMLSLGATPMFLLGFLGPRQGRSIGEPTRRVFELALWGFGGALPECLEFESLSGEIGKLPREVTVPVSTLLIAAYLWIAFCALAFLGRAIPAPRVRRAFLLLAPFLVGGFLLVLGRTATAPIAWFDPGLFIAPEVHSGVWESDRAVLKSFGPVLLAAARAVDCRAVFAETAALREPSVMRFFSLFLLCASALSGCRTLPVTEIPIAKGATFDLQSPAALGQAISLEQIVDAKYGDKEFSFHCLLEVDAKQLTLVGMTPMNTRAFTLTFDGETLAVDVMPGAQMPAPPEHILADLQLALWPDPVVRGLEVEEFEALDRIRDETHASRTFVRAEKPVIEIGYDTPIGVIASSDPVAFEPWLGTIVFEHLEQNYTLTVKTIRAEKLEP